MKTYIVTVNKTPVGIAKGENNIDREKIEIPMGEEKKKIGFIKRYLAKFGLTFLESETIDLE